MGAKSRNKGKAGEREAAALLRELLGIDVRRRVRQHDGDSDLLGVPGWVVEVKRAKSATPAVVGAWWVQAKEQAGRDWPLLLYRLDRQPWRAVWPLRFVEPTIALDMFEYTADTSVTCWARLYLSQQARAQIADDTAAQALAYL